jgi:hypothetical protein
VVVSAVEAAEVAVAPEVVAAAAEEDSKFYIYKVLLIVKK